MLRRASTTMVIPARCGRPPPMEWKPVETNIFSRVPFTWTRCLFFLGSITLYATDIVRSGLGIHDVTAFGNEKLGIGTFSSFGPYSYPVQTIRKEPNNVTNGTTRFFGFAENNVGGFGNQVLQVPIWPYKYDTLAVGLRGLAMELGIQEYPECLLKTSSRCSFESLSLEQVFSMIDGILEAVQTRLDRDLQDRMVFAIQHQSVDTIEQTVFTYFRKEPITRYYVLYSHRQDATKGLAPLELIDVCHRRHHHYDRPSVCTTARWPASLPLLPTTQNETVSMVHIDEHIALRFARFQAEYPDLQMDMIVMATSLLHFVENSASVYYSREGEEISTLLRGRKCDSGQQHRCETVLVDEYRYERSVFDTNVEEMYKYVALLRGTAQVYVWLRLLMLVIGIIVSTWYESRSEHASPVKVLIMSWVNLLKVPSHVVVYGTLVPVVLHALAHLTDCYLYHLIVQDALTTIMGKDALSDIRTDLRYVTLKMRNIWLIGLLCTMIVGYKTHLRHQETWRHRAGIVGFRGSMMSFLSFSTLFFPVRLPSLRQIDILLFTWHDLNWTIDGIITLFRRDFLTAPTGPFLELRCFLLAASSFLVLVLTKQVMARLTKQSFPALMSQSTVVPYSAGTMWSTLALTGYWVTNIDRRPKRPPRPSVVPTLGWQLPGLSKAQPRVGCKIPSHIRALRVESRTAEMWALIRLMNIVMMSNPWEYARLRFIGVPVFVYRLRKKATSRKPGSTALNASHSCPAHPDPLQAFLLPERIERLYEMNQLQVDERFELIDVVSSKNLSWNKLIMCG